jgi:hypothetical protein
MHIGAFVEMAKPFVFAYALCQFIPQAANSLNILGNEFWELGIRPKGTTRAAEGKDFVDVAAENNRRCVIEAILMGFVASAPLLLRTLAYRAEAELAIERRMVSNRPFTKLSNERPTGVNPRPQGYPAPSEPAASGRGPGGTLPAGGQPTIKPSGKTQPGLGNPPPPASPGKTQPGLGNPPAPAPTPLATAKGNLKAAEEAYDEVQRASFETTRDFIRYRNNRLDPNASWDPKVDAELQQKAWDMEQLEIRAVNQLKAARRVERDAAAAARAAQGSGGLQPGAPPPARSPAPCAPACGNENPTVPGDGQVPSQARGSLEVGSAGAASSLSSPPKPGQ